MKQYEQTRVGKQLIFLQLLIGITAICGGVGLLLTNGLGMPVSALEHTIFRSFIIPGLILSIIVGGTHITAAVLMMRKSTIAVEASGVAAFGLLIWLFTEVSILSERNMLQSLYFGLAILEIMLTYLVSTLMHHDSWLRTLLLGKRSRV